MPGSRSTSTARGTYLLPDACPACQLAGSTLACSGVVVRTYLIEVDAHTLQLEIRRAIVPAHTVSNHSLRSHAFRWDTYTPEPSSPCSPEMFCQKAAPIWLPCTSITVNHVDSRNGRLSSGQYVRIGRFGGGPITLILSDPCVAAAGEKTRGTRAHTPLDCFSRGGGKKDLRFHACWRCGDGMVETLATERMRHVVDRMDGVDSGGFEEGCGRGCCGESWRLRFVYRTVSRHGTSRSIVALC